MKEYSFISNNRSFKVNDGLCKENIGDKKVGMISEVDMTSAEQLRCKQQEKSGVRPSYTALVIKAISLALREHPHANRITVGRWFWRRVVQLHRVDVTVMVESALPDGEYTAFADNIRDADKKGLAAITQELQSLTDPQSCQRWREFQWIVQNLPIPVGLWVLRVPRWTAALWVKYRGGAVMISSPAKYGVDLMVGTWPWPLGFSFGFVKERPIVINGAVVARPTMQLTMSFDRRIMPGAPAARFFKEVCENLESAEQRLEISHSEQASFDYEHTAVENKKGGAEQVRSS